MAEQPLTKRRTYFLNEHHELAIGEKQGGGRFAEYVGIDWDQKARRLSSSIEQVFHRARQSRDPLSNSRYFILACPPDKLDKKSNAKNAEQGKLTHTIDYDQEHSRVFSRLGLDLVQVNRDGTAVVHARSDRLEQLQSSSSVIGRLGKREQARWAAIDLFESVPPSLRADPTWVASLKGKFPTDAIVEFQPLLTRLEIEAVMKAMAEMLSGSRQEGLRGIGRDFSGRVWVRCSLTPNSISAIAENFSSVQSIHAPLLATVTAKLSKPIRRITRSVGRVEPVDPRSLPCVAVVDTGVPTDHAFLAAYRRSQFISPESIGHAVGDHGSRVASRVVFGDMEYGDRPPDPIPPGSCSFYDVNVARDRDDLHEKEIIPAMEAVVGNAPDVRVFVLCFDSKQAFEALDDVTRREKLILLQDLDNFVFARDVLVVVASGNSPRGTLPTQSYPRHFEDPNWQLGTWPRCFNALTCGGIIGHLSEEGLAREIGAPSPFSRVGPGFAGSPKPDFAATGGNSDSAYRFRPGLGVWCCSAAGQWEDCSGTSFAAPIVARDAAITMRLLQSFCDSDTRPFAVTVKALLALTANCPPLSQPLLPLADRALGRGVVDISRLRSPSPTNAMFIWQGVIDGPDDLVRVQFPIPRQWLDDSESPRLRVSLAWDSPANAAVPGVWATRRVSPILRFTPDGRALRGSHGSHGSYPLSIREYELDKWPEGEEPSGDLWLIELSYQQTAEDYVGIAFSPQLRVAFAAEIFDESEQPIVPYAALESLPACKTMTRFSIRTAIRNPVVIKVRA